MAKLQNPVKQSFDKVNDDLKDIHSGLGKYAKAIEKKFKDGASPFNEPDHDAMTTQTPLIKRAIVMHLIREGYFAVAATLVADINSRHETPKATASSVATWENDFGPSATKLASLRAQFSEMYHILGEMRSNHNLTPAIEWAQKNSTLLESRGSNLEFDLCRLRYVALLVSPSAGPNAAVAYARQTFPRFGTRFAAQTNALLGALAYTSDIGSSPYASLVNPVLTDSETFATAATAFTSEFCACMNLSSASPLSTAVSAGYIALPTLLKLNEIQRKHGTSWTTAQELPVEVPLPAAYQFHSVFVCPVSKEQSTDSNPPMMLPCAHVIAKESMENLNKVHGGKIKCPYCPMECYTRDAQEVFL